MIFDTYYRPLYRYIYHHVRHVETAEDVTGQVFQRFLAVLRSPSAPDRHLKAWLFRVAHNLIMDESRRQRYREYQPLDAETGLIQAAVDVESDVTRRLLVDQTQAALDTLTPMQREVIILRFLSELSLEETAHILHMNVGAVKAMQHRALATLRRQLIPQHDHEEGLR
jgi:RNA polymerase sigma-70 factor (ECF subfamily)